MRTSDGDEFLLAETATVWTAFDGRRSLTKRTAARRSARALIAQKYPCECDRGDDGHPDTVFVCYRHREAGEEWFKEVEKRLTARIMRDRDRS